MNNHDTLLTGLFLTKCIHACERDLITLDPTEPACRMPAFSNWTKANIFHYLTIKLFFTILFIDAMKNSKENKIQTYLIL